MLSVSLTAYLTARQGRTHKMKSIIVIVPGLKFSGWNGSKNKKVLVFYHKLSGTNRLPPPRYSLHHPKHQTFFDATPNNNIKFVLLQLKWYFYLLKLIYII